MRILLTFAAFAALSVAAPAQQVIRSRADIVSVYTTVTDRDGRIITNLTQDKFEVRDEGKPQPIIVFDTSPKPVQLIVMLDVSGSMEGNLGLLRASAQQLFAKLGPEDVAQVGLFGKDITIAPEFTRDVAALNAALPAEIASDAPTPLWRALDDAMQKFDMTSDRRRVLLVLSDGVDSGPQMGKRFVSQGEVIDRARREDVMVYAIGLRSRGRSSRPPIAIGRGQPGGFGGGGLGAALMEDEPDPALARTAIETGGGYIDVRPRDDLGAAFAQVMTELQSQYLLGFAPPKRDGKKHDLDVRVLEAGMKARARKNYIAPK